MLYPDGVQPAPQAVQRPHMRAPLRPPQQIENGHPPLVRVRLAPQYEQGEKPLARICLLDLREPLRQERPQVPRLAEPVLADPADVHERGCPVELRQRRHPPRHLVRGARGRDVPDGALGGVYLLLQRWADGRRRRRRWLRSLAQGVKYVSEKPQYRRQRVDGDLKLDRESE